MKNPAAILRDFVLDRATAEPVRKRIKLTRALAAVEPCKQQRDALISVADQLAAAERAHRQLVFNFRRNG